MPAEVSPITKPVEAPIATAAILWRRVSSKDSRSRASAPVTNRARASTTTPTAISAIASIVSTMSSRSLP